MNSICGIKFCPLILLLFLTLLSPFLFSCKKEKYEPSQKPAATYSTPVQKINHNQTVKNIDKVNHSEAFYSEIETLKNQNKNLYFNFSETENRKIAFIKNEPPADVEMSEGKDMKTLRVKDGQNTLVEVKFFPEEFVSAVIVPRPDGTELLAYSSISGSGAYVQKAGVIGNKNGKISETVIFDQENLNQSVSGEFIIKNNELYYYYGKKDDNYAGSEADTPVKYYTIHINLGEALKKGQEEGFEPASQNSKI